MKFMLMINLGPRARDFRSLSAEEQQAIGAGYQAINQTAGVTSGNQLQPPETARTVRVERGKSVVSNGPFVDTAQALDGYLFYEADDLDAAIELASRIPAASMGSAIELRALAQR